MTIRKYNSYAEIFWWQKKIRRDAEKGYNFADFEILEMDSSGYVRQMRMGDTVCTGDQFRDALSLSSSAFSFYESIKGLKITTIGKGHGLGMSQWTANEMAKEKKNYEEILQFFFEGTTLIKNLTKKKRQGIKIEFIFRIEVTYSGNAIVRGDDE